MNLFNFNNKQSYMDYVQTLSNEDLSLQRKLMLNLLGKTESRYNGMKTDIELTVVPALKAIIRGNNMSWANNRFQQVLEEFFNVFMLDKNFFDHLKEYSNITRDDSECSREESIKIIEDTYNKLISEDESGCYNKGLSLAKLIINQSAIVMYRLYNVALLNEEELKSFLSAPKVLFGGLKENGEPDLKYTVKRYLYQIKFDMKFVENDF